MRSTTGLRWLWLGISLGLLVGFVAGVVLGRVTARVGAPAGVAVRASPTPGALAATPTPTSRPIPSPSAAPSATPAPTATAVVTPTSTASPSATATATSSPTATTVPTSTPTPTPTRGPLRVTKLGLGVYASGGAVAADMDRWRPSVILLLDPTVDFARYVRATYPKAFIVGRHFVASQPLDNPGTRGAAFADEIATTAVPLKGVVNAWMSYNEVSGYTSGSDNNYAAWNAFQVAFAQRLQGAYGIDAVAGNDGPSAVSPDDYARFFASAISTSHYFGVHAYAPPGVRSFQEPNGKAAMLRYREIHDALQRAGVKSGPFILTETGLSDGWRGQETEDAAAADFIWLTSELDKDPYVIGQAAFGLFLPDNDRWKSFNVAGTLIEQIVGDYNTCAPAHPC